MRTGRIVIITVQQTCKMLQQLRLSFLVLFVLTYYSSGFRLNNQRTGVRVSQKKSNIEVDRVHASKFSAGNAVATISALSSIPTLAVADADNVRNVFQPNLDPTVISSSIIYAVVPVVIYFVFNTILAPKLGLIKEVESGSDNFPPENKTPF